MSLKLRALLVTSLTAACLPALGEQTGEDRNDEAEAVPAITESVEVLSTLPGEEDVAAFATTLRAIELGDRGQDLADVLRRVPGARVHDYGGLGSYATMSLRASTSEQVTVLLDGVPQNRALGGPVDLSSIPATLITNVTVFRGFGPAAYGLGGIGGVVDVRTRPPAEGLDLHVDLLAGELATLRASGGVSLGDDNDRFRIDAEWLRTDGDYSFYDTGETLFNPHDDSIRKRTNNDVDDASTLLQYVRDRLGGGRLRVAARMQDRERGTPGLGTASSTTARAQDSLDDLTIDWTRRYAGAVEGIDLIADGFRQKISLQDPFGEIGLGAQDQTTTLSGGGVAGWIRARLGAHRPLVRVDVRRERASVRDLALALPDRGGAVRDLAAVTAEDLIALRRVTLAPSIRWERRVDDFVAGSGGTRPPPARDVAADAWSGKLGVAWAIRPDAALRGSLGRFHRSPSLLELFGDRGAILGNPTLRPETGLAVEIGYASSEQPTRSWSGEIVAFARRSEDLIHFLPVSQGTAVARNVSRVDTHGVEGAVTLRPARFFTIDVTATRQEATDVSGGFSDGKPLPYQPETLGYLGVGFRRGRARVRWEITYTGGNSTDALDTPEFRLPERVIHDLSLAWELPRGIDLGIDLTNFLGRQTRDLLRYPLPDRVILAHLGWRSRPEKQP